MAKIVQFKNGKYGVFKGIIFKNFLDTGGYYWWSSSTNIKRYCQFDTEQEAKTTYDFASAKYKVIKKL